MLPKYEKIVAEDFFFYLNMTNITFFCLIKEDFPTAAHVFKIIIKKDKSIFNLKKAIKESQTLFSIVFKDVNLWKVEILNDYYDEIIALFLHENILLANYSKSISANDFVTINYQ